MLIFRLVFGLLLLGCVLCLAMGVGTGDPAWRKRGVVILKWALIAAAAFCPQQPIATRNISDFDRFTPYGVKVISIPTLI